MKKFCCAFVILFALSHSLAATFVVLPPSKNLPEKAWVEAYAFSTDSETLIAQIRGRIASGTPVSPQIQIAVGADAVNRNYLAPGAPAWHWHVTEVLDLDAPVETQVVGGHPERDQPLSAVEHAALTIPDQFDQFVSVGYISPRYLTRIVEIDPADMGKVVNISTRGVLGSGENVLIAGFIVQGTTPRLVLVRAMAPSLSAMGVAGAATDASLKLFNSAGQLLAENTGWQNAPWIETLPTWLVPTSLQESAIVMILDPGIYTAHASSSNQGIGLLDVHDLSGLSGAVW